MELGSRPELNVSVPNFICNLERLFDRPVAGGLSADTKLRDLPDWTSLQALIVVASFDTDYGVSISADEFGEAETIQDLYTLVIQKMQQ
jgi:acyl carrier protein